VVGKAIHVLIKKNPLLWVQTLYDCHTGNCQFTQNKMTKHYDFASYAFISENCRVSFGAFIAYFTLATLKV
jgi:hypothetical protein